MTLSRGVSWVLFLGYFLVGVAVYRDYGISFDEPINRVNGIVSMQYVGEKLGVVAPNDEIPRLQTYYDRDYSVIFEIPLLIAEKALALNSDDKSRQLYQMRHLLTFLTFFVAVIFFYLTLFKVFKKQWMAWLGSLFLVLSPRIFAESFYNGKDIVCLAFFIITTYFLLRFIQSYTLFNALCLGFFSAIAINIRLTAVLIPALAVCWAVIDVFTRHAQARQVLFSGLLYLLLTGIFTVAFWPFLWESPLSNFLYAFGSMSRFRFDMDVLFWGQRLPAPQLPRYYILGYAAITTPLLYLGLGLWGMVLIVRDFVRAVPTFKRSLTNEQLRFQWTFLALLVAPFAAVIGLKSVLYDGWRQLYFVYGAFLVVAMYGLQGVVGLFARFNTPMKWSAVGATALYACWIGLWMFQNHPYQNTYFNVLAPQPLEKKFDIDYWGLSYRQGLEWILANDKRPKIKVIANLPPGTHNLMMLRPEDKARLDCEYFKPAVRDTMKTDALRCDYFLTEFRYHSSPAPFHRELHTIKADGHRILAIYDGRDLAH
ncbi:MAG: glycosyltransferase family 39 protein [Spirosomaceae bacterium]|nr:glycosyltransferase family 39 protein [Spirosomataceae bacterium]